MNDLHLSPIVIEKGKTVYSFTPIVVNCVADLPAKAAVLKLNRFNGYSACSNCSHPGKLVRLPPKLTAVRYVNGEEIYPERKHNETVKNMKDSNRTKKIVNGFRGNERFVIYLFHADIH